MRKTKTLVTIMFVVCLGIVPYSKVLSQETRDTFVEWKIAVAGVQTSEIENLNAFLQRTAFSLKALLSGAAKGVNSRDLSTVEHYSAREILREQALDEIQEELDKVIIQRDVEALADDTHRRWIIRRDAKKNIKKIKKRQNRIKKLKNKEIPIKQVLPVKFIEQSDYISISPVADIEKISEELSVNQLFYFTIRELEENYVFIRVYSYNNIRKNTSLILETTVDATNIDQVQKSVSDVVAQSILGSTFASLQINIIANTDDVFVQRRMRDALILLDGETVGFGSANIGVLRTGVHTIIVLAEGFQETINISLQAGEKAVRNVFFTQDDNLTVSIESDPPNAKVYINSEWYGNTPLVIPKPQADTIIEVVLRLVGYEEKFLSLTEKSDDKVELVLTPTQEIPLEERLKRDRKRFYTAFAIFGASLLAPIMLNGFYLNENSSLQAITADGRAPADEIRRATIRRDGLFYSYIGTSVASGALSIYAFVELTRYLKTASEYHKR